jgi:hypothetical protein
MSGPIWLKNALFVSNTETCVTGSVLRRATQFITPALYSTPVHWWPQLAHCVHECFLSNAALEKKTRTHRTVNALRR